MRLWILVLICVIFCGCRDAAEQVVDDAAAAKPRAAVKLTVLVVDDAKLAKGIELLAGEWNERSGGELAVTELTLEDMLAAKDLSADVVIYPSRHLGTLAMRGWLRPVRQSVLDDPNLAWGDFLPTVRDQVIRYGDEVFALSLGEMPLVIAWQGQIPDPLATDWQQLDEMAVRGGDFEGDRFPLTKEFLARALAATSPNDRAGAFFSGASMQADLTQPQMVRALEQVAKFAGNGGTHTAQVTLPRSAEQERNDLAMMPLLPMNEVYNASLQQWETEENSPPVICGFAGRVVSVTETTRNATSAFKLVPWLVSGSTGAQLSRHSPATLWFRASQVSQAARWLPDPGEDNRATWLTESLSRGDAYLLPRIPGIDRYLEVLESALSEAVSGGQSAEDALQAAASHWNAITDELGQVEQRRAFNRHLGLSD